MQKILCMNEIAPYLKKPLQENVALVICNASFAWYSITTLTNKTK